MSKIFKFVLLCMSSISSQPSARFTRPLLTSDVSSPNLIENHTPELPAPKCILPSSPFMFLNSCVSKCPVTHPYYDSNKVCSKCPTFSTFYNTLDNTCNRDCPKTSPYSDFNKICSKCPANAPFYNALGNTCYSECPRSFPRFDVNKICSKCPANAPFYNALDNTCYSECPRSSPYSDVNKICSKCPANAPFYNALDNTCYSECPRSSPYSDVNKICSKCPENAPFYHSVGNICNSTCPFNAWVHYNLICGTPDMCPPGHFIEISRNEIISHGRLTGKCTDSPHPSSTKLGRIAFYSNYTAAECNTDDLDFQYIKESRLKDGKCAYCPFNTVLSTENGKCISQCIVDNNCCPSSLRYVPYSNKCVDTCPKDNPVSVDGYCLPCPPPLLSVNGECVMSNTSKTGRCPPKNPVYDYKARACLQFCPEPNIIYNPAKMECSNTTMVSCKQHEALDTKDGTCRLYPGSGGFTNVLYRNSNNLTLWIHPAACPSQVHVNFMHETLTAGCYWTSIYGFMGMSKDILQTYGSLVLYSNWCPIGTTYNSQNRTCEFGCPPETPLRIPMSGVCMKCPTGLKYVVAKNLCEDECPEEFPFQVSNLCFSCPHGYAYNYGCYPKCPTEAPYIDVAKSATMCTNYCESFADYNKNCVEDCPGYGFHVISESTGVKECVSKCPSEKPRSDANRLCYKP